MPITLNYIIASFGVIGHYDYIALGHDHHTARVTPTIVACLGVHFHEPSRVVGIYA